MRSIRQYLSSNKSGMNVFSLIMFLMTMMLSFDRFCFDTITTETPLLKIGTLPFSRMEFITIIFALSGVFGVLTGILAKKKNRKYSSVIPTILGMITLFVVLFDIDMLQILAPDMRISHVTMTLSRMMAIILGITGFLYGVAIVMLETKKEDIMFALAGILASTFLSLTALIDKQYIFVYTLMAIVLIVIGISGDFFKKAQENEGDILSQSDIRKSCVLYFVDKIISVFSITIFASVSYSYIVTNLGYSLAAYTICISLMFVFMCIAKTASAKYEVCKYLIIAINAVSIILSIMAIFINTLVIVILSCIAFGTAFGLAPSKDNKHKTADKLSLSLSVLTGSIISYIIIHKMSDITIYSANRVVYALTSKFYILIAVCFAIKLIIQIIDCINSQNKEKKDENIACR